MTDSFHPDQQAEDDLTWLMAHGAAQGVAAVLHERRRQIEQLGWTPEHDRRDHSEGGLASMAARRITQHKLFNKPGDLPAAGALLAAEFDRLDGEAADDEQRWRNGG